jgi:hypothetical protein
LTGFRYDPQTRDGVLEFDNSGGGGVTEIAIPRRLYPNGVSAVVDGSQAELGWDASAQRLFAIISDAGPVAIRFEPA